MNFKNTGLIFLISAITACQSAKEKSIAQIENAEKQMLADSTLELKPDVAQKLIIAYTDFALTYPNDTMAGNYLLKAAEISNAVNKSPEAIHFLQEAYQKFPNHSKAPLFLFLQGFTYETQIGDLDKAKYCYNQFLLKYPKHVFADDVRHSVENLGKSNEQLIKEFEEKISGDSVHHQLH